MPAAGFNQRLQVINGRSLSAAEVSNEPLSPASSQKDLTSAVRAIAVSLGLRADFNHQLVGDTRYCGHRLSGPDARPHRNRIPAQR
jgi:hypothetical protein